VAFLPGYPLPLFRLLPQPVYRSHTQRKTGLQPAKERRISDKVADAAAGAYQIDLRMLRRLFQFQDSVCQIRIRCKSVRPVQNRFRTEGSIS